MSKTKIDWNSIQDDHTQSEEEVQIQKKSSNQQDKLKNQYSELIKVIKQSNQLEITLQLSTIQFSIKQNDIQLFYKGNGIKIINFTKIKNGLFTITLLKDQALKVLTLSNYIKNKGKLQIKLYQKKQRKNIQNKRTNQNKTNKKRAYKLKQQAEQQGENIRSANKIQNETQIHNNTKTEDPKLCDEQDILQQFKLAKISQQNMQIIVKLKNRSSDS